MNASRKRDVHACLFLLPLLKAAWLCLASVIMISKRTSSKSEHLYIHVEHISLTAVSHFCNDPNGFLQLSHKVSLVGRHGRRYSQSTLCSLQDALGLAQGDLPTPWEHSCSEAAMTNFTGKAQGWHKLTSEHGIHSQRLPVPVRTHSQLVVVPGYHHLPSAYRKHWWLEPSFVSLNPSADLSTGIDSCSREDKEKTKLLT